MGRRCPLPKNGNSGEAEAVVGQKCRDSDGGGVCGDSRHRPVAGWLENDWEGEEG